MEIANLVKEISARWSQIQTRGKVKIISKQGADVVYTALACDGHYRVIFAYAIGRDNSVMFEQVILDTRKRYIVNQLVMATKMPESTRGLPSGRAKLRMHFLGELEKLAQNPLNMIHSAEDQPHHEDISLEVLRVLHLVVPSEQIDAISLGDAIDRRWSALAKGRIVTVDYRGSHLRYMAKQAGRFRWVVGVSFSGGDAMIEEILFDPNARLATDRVALCTCDADISYNLDGDPRDPEGWAVAYLRSYDFTSHPPLDYYRGEAMVFGPTAKMLVDG